MTAGSSSLLDLNLNLVGLVCGLVRFLFRLGLRLVSYKILKSMHATLGSYDGFFRPVSREWYLQHSPTEGCPDEGTLMLKLILAQQCEKHK